MTFKFGLLVLLLVLENAIAEQRMSKDSTGSLVYALRRGPQLRQNLLRADQSPFRGLLSSSFHHSFNFTEATCLWDDQSEECTLSLSGMKRLLEESDTEFAKMLVERLKCVVKTNKADCRKESACVWSGGLYPVCRYVDLRKGHEDSPCAKVAPRYFDYREAWTQCARNHSYESCRSKRQCRWLPWLGSCRVAREFVYYDIEHFIDKRSLVKGMVFARLKTKYLALQSAEDFTWQSILDYKPGSIECPSGIEQLVCDYLVAYWSDVQSREFYCSGKYKSDASGCRSDAVCRWNTVFVECRSHESYPTSADQRSASRVLTDSMPEGTDKSLREAYNRCEFSSESKCLAEHCIWNPLGGYCALNQHYIATLLTKPGKDSTDALCTFLAVDRFSNCYDTFSKVECNHIKVCRWSRSYGCVPNEELYISKAEELDPKLRNKYLQVKGRCSRHTSLRECFEDNKFNSKVKLLT